MNYNLNSIFELLIYSRILFPASKNETYNKKDIFFDNFDFSLKDLYRSLDYFNSFKDELQLYFGIILKINIKEMLLLLTMTVLIIILNFI